MRRLAPRHARRTNRRSPILTATAGNTVEVTASAGGSGPDANTTFLTRFTASPPVDEISLATGTLFGNATCDTANSRVTLDGTGDWVTFADQAAFDLPAPFTLEVHTNQAAAQVGGLVARATSGASRWLIYCNGDGSGAFYLGNSAILTLSFGTFDGAEHHIAIARTGNSWWAYKDGVQTGTTATDATVIAGDTVALFIGTDPFSDVTRDLAANIGRVKISNICRYPNGTTFTPPARTAA